MPSRTPGGPRPQSNSRGWSGATVIVVEPESLPVKSSIVELRAHAALPTTRSQLCIGPTVAVDLQASEFTLPVIAVQPGQSPPHRSGRRHRHADRTQPRRHACPRTIDTGLRGRARRNHPVAVIVDPDIDAVTGSDEVFPGQGFRRQRGPLWLAPTSQLCLTYYNPLYIFAPRHGRRRRRRPHPRAHGRSGPRAEHRCGVALLRLVGVDVDGRVDALPQIRQALEFDPHH